jgi:hypothetical protein
MLILAFWGQRIRSKIAKNFISDAKVWKTGQNNPKAQRRLMSIYAMTALGSIFLALSCITGIGVAYYIITNSLSFLFRENVFLLFIGAVFLFSTFGGGVLLFLAYKDKVLNK